MIQEIITKNDWNHILEQVENYDFYHTFDYHKLSLNEGESAVLVVYKTEGILVAIPLILRPISGTDYCDFTSIYGYAGPVYKSLNDSFNIEDFRNELLAYFNSKNCVSVFSRLHPYINKQETILTKLGSIEALGEVVNIDVTLPVDISRQAYGKSNKNQINKLRRSCTVRKAETEADILEFVDIYYENMHRLKAKKQYFFCKEYFLSFMKQTDFNTDILLVIDNETDTAIAGSMFVKTNNIVQFHLSGTRTDYLRLKPSKLFLDEMRLQATNQNFTYFNLGGGLGSEHDSLFEFKASFSKDFRAFKLWKLIVNNSVYNDLSKDIDTEDSTYFPLYRAT